MPSVLPDLLRNAAREMPSHGVGYIRPDHSVDFTSYPDLLLHASHLLAGLQDLGVDKGDKVILSLDRCDEIVPVMWACFLGGIIPALLQPPVSFSEHNPAAEKAEKVFRLLGNPRVILSHSHRESWQGSDVPEHLLLDVQDIPLPDESPVFPSIVPGDLAFIQFSSGSTGDPKGIMLTHYNVLCNLEAITSGIQINPFDYSVSWLPLYHDMGLVGFHLTPVYNYVKHYLIEPVDFVKNPGLWLDSLSDKKCRISACPNFGQVIVNRYLGRKRSAEWDFSSLRVMFNGAEPISVTTMNEFIDGMGAFGFDPAAMFPAYGMAEATLAITFPPLSSGARVVPFRRDDLLRYGKATACGPEENDPVFLVNLGKPILHCGIRLIGEDDSHLPENVIGNVQALGLNITQGYFGDPETTQQAFAGKWLKTGDLGFLHGGDLFITGRSKDIIFINGTNYYAHDLETVALRVEGISYGKIIIAGYFDEKESRDRLLIFMVGADNEATRETFFTLKSYFLNHLGLSADIFIPIRSNDIPRTSSGKIQRYIMVARFLRNEFPSVIRI
jgi:acyl-CoA synthetase (AMP-forming)/AMP-acid ligase II